MHIDIGLRRKAVRKKDMGCTMPRFEQKGADLHMGRRRRYLIHRGGQSSDIPHYDHLYGRISLKHR